MPPLLELLFTLLTKLEGSAISNAPKNDKANNKNIIKKIIFAIAEVAKSFATSAPKITETPIPKIE